jgi:hypothetical protein
MNWFAHQQLLDHVRNLSSDEMWRWLADMSAKLDEEGLHELVRALVARMGGGASAAAFFRDGLDKCDISDEEKRKMAQAVLVGCGGGGMFVGGGDSSVVGAAQAAIPFRDLTNLVQAQSDGMQVQVVSASLASGSLELRDSLASAVAASILGPGGTSGLSKETAKDLLRAALKSLGTSDLLALLPGLLKDLSMDERAALIAGLLGEAGLSHEGIAKCMAGALSRMGSAGASDEHDVLAMCMAGMAAELPPDISKDMLESLLASMDSDALIELMTSLAQSSLLPAQRSKLLTACIGDLTPETANALVDSLVRSGKPLDEVFDPEHRAALLNAMLGSTSAGSVGDNGLSLAESQALSDALLGASTEAQMQFMRDFMSQLSEDDQEALLAMLASQMQSRPMREKLTAALSALGIEAGGHTAHALDHLDVDNESKQLGLRLGTGAIKATIGELAAELARLAAEDMHAFSGVFSAMLDHMNPAARATAMSAMLALLQHGAGDARNSQGGWNKAKSGVLNCVRMSTGFHSGETRDSIRNSVRPGAEKLGRGASQRYGSAIAQARAAAESPQQRLLHSVEDMLSSTKEMHLQDMRQLYVSSEALNDPDTDVGELLGTVLPSDVVVMEDLELTSHIIKRWVEYHAHHTSDHDKFGSNHSMEHILKLLAPFATTVPANDVAPECSREICLAIEWWVGHPVKSIDWAWMETSIPNLVFLFALAAMCPGMEPPASLLEKEWGELATLQGMLDTLHRQKATSRRKSMAQLEHQIMALHNSVEAKLAAVKEGHLMWRRARERILHRTMSELAGTLNKQKLDDAASGEDSTFIDAFHNLDEESLSDLLATEPDPAASLAGLYDIMECHCSALRLIFKAYACWGAQPSVITREDFKKIMSDIDVCDDKNVPPAQVDIIFVRSSRAGAGLTPAKFLEAIVRLAFCKFKGVVSVAKKGGKKGGKKKGGKKAAVVDPSDPTSWSLCKCTEELLQRFLLPKALRSDGIAFRKLVATERVQQVFDKFKQPLNKIFTKFAASDQYDDSQADLNLKEFIKFMTDHNLFGGPLNKKMGQSIFNNCQITRYGENAQAQESQMDDEEFVEAVAAIAVVLNPNPYIAFEQVCPSCRAYLAHTAGSHFARHRLLLTHPLRLLDSIALLVQRLEEVIGRIVGTQAPTRGRRLSNLGKASLGKMASVKSLTLGTKKKVS